MFIGVATVTLGIFVNSLAGFAFAVFEFSFKRALFAVVLLSFMMPHDRGLFWRELELAANNMGRPEQVSDYRGGAEKHEAEHGAAA